MENTEILKKITKPADLKNLDVSQIETLCQEIRTRIIDATSQNGGHVGPNLGVVELTVALHLAFDTPKDSFFWDVSHQGYVHKLLTGRNDEKFDKNNLLTRGQTIKDISLDKTDPIVLKAGQISLHHPLIVHGSGLNNSDDRRIGFVVQSYIGTDVDQVIGKMHVQKSKRWR